jgi:dihydrofolate synthase/folylpolyglutamate synthase
MIIVDGAHNADSAHQLLVSLRELFPSSRLHIIFGASNDKDIEGMFAELLPGAESICLTRSRNPRAADPARLGVLASPYQVQISFASDVGEALVLTRRHASRDDVICVTGSLFVVADARTALFAERGLSLHSD